jgi:starch-binding outer membrane protein, SusD/RagB family
MRQLTQLIKYTTTILVIAMAIGSLPACKKNIEIDEPVHLITTDAVFTNDKTATSSVVGIYSEMMRTRYFFASGAMTIYPGMSADEIYSTFPSSTRDPFKDNALLSTNGTIRNDIWRFGYSFIYRANASIEGINSAISLTPGAKQQLLGEALFIRAFCHFYLTNLFGDIPLVTTTDYRVNMQLPRAASTEVNQQILADLNEAAELLPAPYTSTGKVRPNEWAATALLARVYLYEKDWKNAEEAANAVINSGSYQLIPDLNKVFLANSAEAIWQLAPVLTNSGNNTHEGFLFVPFNATTVPSFRITSNLVSAFETDDARKVSWVGKNTINGEDYYFPLKYKVSSNAPSAPVEYNMVLRLAEQYLIRAEALAQQNKLEAAQQDLNMIRTRAGLQAVIASDKESLLAAIEQERRIELFAEWGHRWFDLKRTNRIDAVLASVKGVNWQPTDALYPIPLGEILINTNLDQNPGY